MAAILLSPLNNRKVNIILQEFIIIIEVGYYEKIDYRR